MHLLSIFFTIFLISLNPAYARDPLTCFCDKGTVEFTSVELNSNKTRFEIEGFIKLNKSTGIVNQIPFSLSTRPYKIVGWENRIESVIEVFNPFVGEVEVFEQDFSTYLEFHILENRAHDVGSTGFGVGDSDIYGFGIQCFATSHL